MINEYGPTEATVGCVAARIAPGEPVPARPGRRSAGPPGTPGVPARRRRCGRCRPAWPASCTSPGARLARGYLRRPGAHRRALPALPVRRRRAGGCTAPATWPAGGRTGPWSTWAAATTRSRCAAYRIELGRDRGGAAGPPGRAPRRRCWSARTTRASRRWSATSSARPSRTRSPPTWPATLPAHLVPAAFVALDALPLTAERQARPGPRCRAAGAGAATATSPPRTDAEALVAEVFAEILAGGEGRRAGRLLRPRRQLAARRCGRWPGSAPRSTSTCRCGRCSAIRWSPTWRPRSRQLIAAELDDLSDDEVAALLAAEEDTTRMTDLTEACRPQRRPRRR